MKKVEVSISSVDDVGSAMSPDEPPISRGDVSDAVLVDGDS